MVITATGGTVVAMRRFDAEQALALVEQHRATHSQWVPTMFVRMLKLPDDVRRTRTTSPPSRSPSTPRRRVRSR